MELIAAIDLVDGKATRLEQGDFNRPLHAGTDPVELARGWVAAGVRRLHVVDLDGARAGRPVHAELIGRMASAVHEASSRAHIEASGGLRDPATVEELLAVGADDVVLGSAAIVDRGFLADCAVRWPGRVGAALDVREGRVSIDGWTRDVPADATAMAGQLLAAGASRLVVTDVLRDGTASGPNVALMGALRDRFPTATLVASGGIAGTDDLRELAELGLDAAIVGRALLDGSLTVADALEACAAAAAA